MKKIKKTFLLFIIVLIISSCVSTKIERSNYFPGTEQLSRNDYKVIGDRVSEGTITTSYGFIQSTQFGKDYKKGVIGSMSKESGSILVGGFKIKLSGFVTGIALSYGSALIITKLSGTVNNVQSDNYGNPRIPVYLSIVPGTVIGLSLNNVFSHTPTQKAMDLANYNFLTNHKSDYLLNPRYEINEKGYLFKKTVTVKLTSKGINILPDIE
jgi:hypothetical protein